MSELVTTAPPSVELVEGKKRAYVVKVDKGHRPAQIPKKLVPTIYAGEVTTDNVDKFLLMCIREDLHRQVMELFGGDKEGDQPADNMTFNEMLGKVLDWISEVDSSADKENGSLPGGMRDLTQFIRDEDERDKQLRIYDESHTTQAAA